MESILQVHNIKKVYHTADNAYPVLSKVDLEVQEGQFVAVVGQSGSGKTTLLNIISGFLTADAGEVKIAGRDILKVSPDEMAEIRQTKLGFVFQDFMLIDGLTARENIFLPQTICGKDSTQMKTHTDMLIKEFGLSDVADKYPGEISGGQKQRVAVARALSNNPFLILADEPTGNLDSKSSAAVIHAFVKAQKELKATILMVTHDPVAASYADRVIAIADGIVMEELCRRNSKSEDFVNKIYQFMGRAGGETDGAQ